MKQIDTYQNKNILVLGLGKSGFAVSKLLLQLGAKVTLNDKNDLDKDNRAAALAAKGVHVIGGSHPLDLFTRVHFDYLVKNPGIPYENPMVQRAQELQIPVITEPEIALSASSAPYVCVTGSNGKTTTVMLTQRILERHLAPSGHHA
ncbi:UDP-N-acetylmuramoyl-L-alanine--D-glutamate ligase, partial [Lactobacillus sp. XV13L]|nr:UDP-N-acetylmuramoyl-L-alanine--D-glutamate ligase [Lactobacillus sp. XV13L]